MGIKLFSSDNYEVGWFCDECNGVGGNRKCGNCGKSATMKLSYPIAGTPDPENYKILRSLQLGKYLVLMLQYPDCQNYEGKKILVYESDIKSLLAQNKIDPHFSNNANFKSPIARFVPTLEGWNMAKLLCTNLITNKDWKAIDFETQR